MKKFGYSIVLGTIVLVLGYLFSLVREPVFGQPPTGTYSSHPQVVVKPPADPPKWLVDFSSTDDPTNPARKLRVITIVDPETQRIVVYHEDLALGTVKWCSTRNIQPDLSIDAYNAIKPTPREVEDNLRRLGR